MTTVSRRSLASMAGLFIALFAVVWLFSVNTAYVNAAENTAAGINPGSHVVEIKGFKFEPAELEVAIGDTVTWINRDIVPHTATALDKSWDSGSLETGQEYSMEITAETALEYFCFFHPSMKASMLFGLR